MNANELADEVIEVLGEFWLSTQCAAMLRQQHADLKIADDAHDILTRTINEQQTEIKALKKHNEELQKACVETLVWVMGNGGYCSLDIEVILKNVLGSEWEDYK